MSALQVFQRITTALEWSGENSLNRRGLALTRAGSFDCVVVRLRTATSLTMTAR